MSLCKLGEKLGSDVPFCIMGGTMLATGRGEILAQVADMPKVNLVLVKPKIDVSTAWVYKNYHKVENEVVHPDNKKMRKALILKDINQICACLKNVLEYVTIKQYPQINDIKEKLCSYGAKTAMMSGSGPTVFAIVKNKTLAEEIAAKIKNDFDAEVFTVETASKIFNGGVCMNNKLAPIKLDSYQPLREVVFETLRDAIRKGILKPGERLMEIHLAEQLGVSRTPVREAIRKLELEGYVIMMPRRGTYVSNLSIKDINEVFEIRTSLDSLASGLAAERITDDELEQLQRLLVIIGEAIKERDMDKIVEADTKFHDLLYQASRNNRLVGIIHNLREQLTSFRAKSMAYPGRLEETLEEHRRIVDTIAQGNVEAAQKASEYHMERSEHTLLLSMEDKEGNME